MRVSLGLPPVSPKTLTLCFSLFIFALLVATSLAAACDIAAQKSALTSFYYATGGPTWRHQGAGSTAWLSDAPCIVNVSGPLPGNVFPLVLPRDAAYCCWRGVRCCTGLPDCIGENQTQCCDPDVVDPTCHCGSDSDRGLVTVLELSSNNLTSWLGPALQELLPLNCTLRRLVLNNNKMPGTLPGMMLSAFGNLRRLGLSANRLTGTISPEIGDLPHLLVVDLTNNHLTGTVPSSLCKGKYVKSPIADLLLSSNNLNGTFDVPSCESMVSLDLGNNQFSGLGSFSGYQSLHILRWGNNSLNGVTFPESLVESNLLVDWTAALAGGTGPGLAGPLPDFLLQMTALGAVNMASNQITGTLPEALFTSLGSLISLILSKNQLSGTIPTSIGMSPLSALNVHSNKLHGTIPEEMGRLVGLSYSINLGNNRLFCCGGDYNGTSDLMSYTMVNYSARRLPSFLRPSTVLNFVVHDPEYANESLVNQWGAMRCPMLVSSSLPLHEQDDVSNVLSWTLDPQYFMFEGCVCEVGFRMTLVSVPQVIVVPTYACIRVQPGSWLSRNMWIIAVIVIGGLLVLLWLTWLACYRRGSRPSFLQAFVNLKKRVKGEPTAGVVTVVNTDIEGFSDLMKQSPVLMTKALGLHNAAIRKARWTNFGYTVDQEGDSYSLCFYEPLDAVMFCLQAQQLLMVQPWPEGLFSDGTHVLKRRTGSVFQASLINMWKSTKSALSLGKTPSNVLQGGASLISMQTAETPGGAAATPYSPSFAAPSAASARASPSSAPELRTSTEYFGNMSCIMSTPGDSLGGSCPFFNGMRVRMGIATGILPSGTTVLGSSIVEMAKVVGDAGSGGQVLMDQATFLAVKERAEELAAVDTKGLNLKKLNQIRPPWWMFWKKKGQSVENEAIVLDMGEYIFSQARSLPIILHNSFSVESSMAIQDLLQAARDLVSGSQPATPTSGSSRKGEARLRLYQISPPSLSGRVKVFQNKLALKEEWVCVDSPYFSAPGTLHAPVGFAVDSTVALPPVTMVFCCVDGGKAYAKSARREAQHVHLVIASLIRSTLRQVPGGYLCRLQDGDLKYMLAFPTPATALAWCLVTQEAMLYAPWPEDILKYDKFKEEWTPDNQLLFRGPRLKMGVCDGCPKSILPDHLGRADYHGASVNQSARFMDAGAHGGQVVCEEEVAVDVLRLLGELEHEVSSQPGWEQGQGQRCEVSTAPQMSSPLSSEAAAGRPLEPVNEDIEGDDTSSPKAQATAPPEVTAAARDQQITAAADSGSQGAVGGPSLSAGPVSLAGAVASPTFTALRRNLIAPRFGSSRGPYVTSVSAHRTGVFRFKGNSEDVHMVHVVLGSLAERRFPSEPPKGKGNRIAEASGLVLEAQVHLPDVSLRYKDHYLANPCTPSLPSLGRQPSQSRFMGQLKKGGSMVLARSKSSAAVPRIRPGPAEAFGFEPLSHSEAVSATRVVLPPPVKHRLATSNTAPVLDPQQAAGDMV